MSELGNMVDARLMVLVPVLFLLGAALKKSPVRDWLIPYLLAAAGAALSFAFFAGAGLPKDAAGFFGMLFSAVTQGVLCAACSVYAKNLWKQFRERKQKDENGRQTDHPGAESK